VWYRALWSHRLMDLAKTNDLCGVHPFGGCNRLLEQYQQIGRALVAYEQVLCGALIPAQRLVREFSAAVAFVPVEVLESYLDDLLDLGVTDDSLFIKKSRPAKRALLLMATALVGLCGAVCVWEGDLTAAVLPALLVTTFLAGIGSAMYFLPRTKVIRRFSLATVVSREVASRRGLDKTDVGSFATRFLRGDMWKLNDRSPGSALPPYPARAALRYFH
jgi:hypothetical protein